MSKRWTFEEDLFLFRHFDALGMSIGPHDLGRPEIATVKRVRKLKASGAWLALENYERSIMAHKRRYYEALGNKPMVDCIDQLCLPGQPEVADRLRVIGK